MIENKQTSIEDESIWILPSELKKQENLERSGESTSIDLKSDFGSYNALLNGQSFTLIETHNSVGLRSKAIAAHLNRYIKNYRNKPSIIGDMGCGAGFIANDLKKLQRQSEIYAYDISSDAINYAKKSFPSILFDAKAIEPDSEFGIAFNVIYAHEFYPFTRTNSFDFQKLYIDNFLKNIDMHNNGLLLISLKHTEKCLINNYDKLFKQYNDEYEIIKYALPSFKIYNLFKNYSLSALFTKIINFLFSRKNSYIITISKSK
jgi:SAM-dependent methyltransferase